ncbi:MAG: hypothetical protein ACI33M_07640, partial [Lysinibacillus sp.]
MKLLWKKSTLERELTLVSARTLGKTKSDESYAAFEHSQAECPMILMLSIAIKRATSFDGINFRRRSSLFCYLE